jgi:hypothetical protein
VAVSPRLMSELPPHEGYRCGQLQLLYCQGRKQRLLALATGSKVSWFDVSPLFKRAPADPKLLGSFERCAAKRVISFLCELRLEQTRRGPEA